MLGSTADVLFVQIFRRQNIKWKTRVPAKKKKKSQVRKFLAIFAILHFWIAYTLERPQPLKKPNGVGRFCEIFKDPENMGKSCIYGYM